MNTASDGEKRRLPLPLPKKFEYTGETFPLPSALRAPAEFEAQAMVLAGYVKRLYGFELKVAESADRAAAYEVTGGMAAGEYNITAENGKVTLRAADAAGFSYASSLLFQMLEKSDGRLYIPAFRASDRPDSGWRGLMIDLARGNYPLSDILTYADLCWFYRLDKLHLHFADGYAYKLPSSAFPKLTNIENGYSAADIETLKSYLKDRAVTIVPEIEMPAHCERLGDVYPEIFGGTHKGLICFGNTGVYAALGTLIGEVCEMFPDSPYIHIGCDEAPYRRWDECPDCATYMRREGIKSSKELYSHTVQKCAEMVLERGRTPVVWEGFTADGAEGIPRETVVMVFQSTYFNARELTEAGFRVVNTSWQPLYIVPSRPKYWPPKDIYRWNFNRWLYEDAKDDSAPIDAELTDRVLGAELCVWESVNFDRDGEVVRNNLPPLAERCWNHERRLTYDGFAAAASPLDAKIKEICDMRGKLQTSNT